MTEKDQCDELFDSLLTNTQRLLEKNREFYPIGEVIESNGKFQPTLTYNGNEHPDSNDVISELKQIHKYLAGKNEIVASGIAYNARISTNGKKEDAIIVRIEHRNCYCANVILPYKFGLFRKITYGMLFAQKDEQEIF